MDEDTLKFMLNVFITVVLIFALISFISLIKVNLATPDIPKKLIQVVTIEGLQTPLDTSIIMDKGEAFCEKYR